MASQFGSRPLQLRTRCFADFGEEHANEMAGAHSGATS
jgi:hypothetical protein